MLTFQIRQYEFQLSEPFSEGHRLSTSEAWALNRLRAENIRNNVAKLVREAQDHEQSVLLPEPVLAKIRAQIAEYDQTYQFSPPKTRNSKNGTLEQEIRIVAEELAEQQARRLSRENDQHLISQLTSDYLNDPSVAEAARRRIVARSQIASESLESLL